MVKLSLILILFALPILVRAKTQKVIAYGTFICQSSEKEAKGIKLKLLSKDDVGELVQLIQTTDLGLTAFS